MRFIFSKWTLREGWDNPNVFQIVKLRSSGSEISKLQEVGRGLRLPVDVYGNRLSAEQFYLTYLIDYTEESFANSLVNEINTDIAKAISIKELLPKVAEKRGIDANDLFSELFTKKIIDYNQELIEGQAEELYRLYPEFAEGKLKSDKVVTDYSKTKVKIRKERYSELKQLWEAINAKYYLHLEDITEAELDRCINEIIAEDVYRTQSGRFTQEKLSHNEDGEIETKSSTIERFDVDATMPYGEWLKCAYSQTYLPLARIHAGFVRANTRNPLPKDFFNKATLAEFVSKFMVWMQNEYINRFSYTRIDGTLGATALTDADGEPLREIVQGNVGIYRDLDSEVPDKFLYDAFIYDSPKEHDTIRDSVMDEVVVYGKIPRRSINVPIYFGGTISPDFMYVLHAGDGKMSLNFIIETKDVESSTDLRGTEQLSIRAAKKFFESISDDNINVRFAPQLKRDDIVALINQVIAK